MINRGKITKNFESEKKEENIKKLREIRVGWGMKLSVLPLNR